MSKSWQRKNYIEHQLAAVWQKLHSLLLSPVVAIRPVSVVSIAIRSVEAIAIVSVPGISLGLRTGSGIGSGLSISRSYKKTMVNALISFKGVSKLVM